MEKAAQFKPFIFCSFITLVIILTSPFLFSQVVLDGNVTDNGAEYLGSGAGPVEGVLVTLTEISSGEGQTVHTDEDGYYSFEITLTGIHEDDFARASAFKVLQNYPNPFNPSTVIPFQIQRPAHITLAVYNVLGRKVKTLIDGYQSASGYVLWDATDDLGRGVTAGVYIYTLKAEGVRASRKMLLLDGHQASASAAVTVAQAPVSAAAPVMHKTASNNFTLTIEGEDIEGYEQDIEITGNMTLPITVNRTMTGNDDRVYRTVKIGDQWWMMENLRETQYRSGDAITNVTDSTTWAGLTTGARCAYNNNESTANTYGYLYNWYALNDSRNIAPSGWRVPTDDDWKELEMFLGMSQTEADDTGYRGNNEGSKLAGRADLWDSGALENNTAFEESGFSALPASGRDSNLGRFGRLGSYTSFWSATEYSADDVWIRALYYGYSTVRRNYYNGRSGFSVRLIRGENAEPHTVSTPNAPSGPDAGEISEDLEFTTGGSVCSEGHGVEYRFDRGDGTYSSWGDATRNISYSDTGTYEIRSQARCAADTSIISAWSDEKRVTVTSGFETGTLTGNDGRVYRTVKIGDQWWMMENLRETQYRNGDAIPEVTDNTAWSELSAGARSVYENDEDNAEIYGYLYNWYALADIAPEGWRVPTDEDFKALEMALGMSEADANLDGWRGSDEGSKLAGNADLWDSGALKNHVEFGTSGFNALPAGYRGDYDGGFGSLGRRAYFWSATEGDASGAWYRYLGYGGTGVYRNDLDRRRGFSLRLICIEEADLHTVSTPNAPSGPDTGETSDDMEFATTGSVCSEGHGVEYRFDWDDGTYSSWGDASRTISYSDTGTYEIRSQARCIADTSILSAWSDEKSVAVHSAFETGTMTGNDGRVYQTVTIGDQVWMAENLRETQYRNGDAIPEMTDYAAWAGLATGARCSYDNDEDNADTYGYLYNWYAVDDAGNIAPEGWRVATDDDWTALVDYLGGSSAAGGKMKTTGTTHWASPNEGATNESGFSALPAGWRSANDGISYDLGNDAIFWSATESNTYQAWRRCLYYNFLGVYRYDLSKQSGFSVRLVKGDDIVHHTVSTPNAPSGPDAGETNEDLEFTTGGSVCSQGHNVEYRFDWGDGTYSSWGDATRNISYSDTGTYEIRSQARCAADTSIISAWSEEKSVTVTSGFETGTMTGNDGRVYQIVKIGDQWWMMENLRETQYRNGDAIPEVTDNTAWKDLSTGARCAYDNDEDNADIYGYLYNWYAVDDAGNIAPEGWRVPTDEDFKALEMAIGMSEADANLDGWRGSDEGSKLAGNASLWDSGVLKNHAEFGTSGINALPAGYRSIGSGSFYSLGHHATFWSATEYDVDGAWGRTLIYGSSGVFRGGYDKQDGFSLRLIKGESTDEHIVSKPDVPSGPDAGEISEDLAFLTGGSSCSHGHGVEYRFDWGDGTTSDWGAASRSTSYASVGEYSIRAQARCAEDNSIESEWSITRSVTISLAPNTMMGNDGRVYQTVTIGDQVWMAENLRETKYRSGDDIPEVTDDSAWAGLATGARCSYDNDEDNADTYGYLYNWYAVDDAGNIAPEGWRVPTDDDFKALEMALGMSEADANLDGWRGSDEGSKFAGNADLWDSGALKNHAEFGTSGYNALPAGYRDYGSGLFYFLGSNASFWSAAELNTSNAWGRYLGYDNSGVGRSDYGKQGGVSLRLIRE